jgi:hypothetical protein
MADEDSLKDEKALRDSGEEAKTLDQKPTNNWPFLVAYRCSRPWEECILLARPGGQDPPLPASHRVAGWGTKSWCEELIKNNCKSSLTHRQYLAYLERDRAARFQIIENPNNRHYRVPHGRTQDERPYDQGGFPRFAASFNKLLAHEAATGLLTDAPGGCNDPQGNPHQQSGLQNYERLLQGLRIDESSSNFGDQELYDLELCAVPPPLRPRVIINPRSSKALSTKGPDITSIRVSRLLYGAEDEARLLSEISLSSDFTAAEIVEVYAMALLRSEILGRYQDSQDAALAKAALNSFGANFVWGVRCVPPGGGGACALQVQTAASGGDDEVSFANLFRGPTIGDRSGDYLSVFLTFPRPPLFPAGCAPFVADLIGASQFADRLGEQLLVPLGADKDFVDTWEQYVSVQNGQIPVKYPPDFFTGRTPIRTGRDLGNYVHVDNVYEEYIRAADILVSGQYPRTPQSPYATPCAPPNNTPSTCYRNEGDGPTLGPSDLYAIIGGVREVAERAAFTQKYLVARRARPEVMAALIDRAKNGNAELRARLSDKLFPADPNDAVNRLLERVRQWNQSRNGGEANYLLPQMYPEGSPAHPAWTSGHATVAGACVTVIKAIFDDTHAIIDPFQPPPPPGQPPPVYHAPNGDILTVGGELDKLASNVSLGRDFGGVHYRTDGEHGILLGEEVAIRYLQDHIREYREHLRKCRDLAGREHEGLTLTKRNGQRICITPDAIFEVERPPMMKLMRREDVETRIHMKSLL